MVICKQNVNKSIKTKDIEDLVSLAKRAINCIVITIINCYQIIVGKAFYLILTNTKDIFSVTWCLANNLDT